MAEVEYSDGEVLFNKKDSATNFYVLKSGEIELFDPDTNKKLAILEKGASFGEQAILAGGVRSVSAKAIGNVICIEITADALKKMSYLALRNSSFPSFNSVFLFIMSSKESFFTS